MNRTDCSTRNHLPAYCECDMADLDKRISGERTSELARLRESYDKVSNLATGYVEEIARLRESNARLLAALTFTTNRLERKDGKSLAVTMGRSAIAAGEGEK